MNDKRRVLCPENQGLADYVFEKKQEHADKPKGLSENMERTFVKAFRNVCDAKEPINTLKDLSQIKGFGKLMVRLMKGYFDTGAESSDQEDLPKSRAGKKAKVTKRYIPQRNSVAYALLITLLRVTKNGKEFMGKQELIDAADASGLSHAPVGPEKGKGKAGLGNSKREWYSGWSCMTTLIQKGLVVKSSNPAKYMLTVEGRDVANECITRSGLPNSVDILSDDEMDPAQHAKKRPNQNSNSSFTMREEQSYADPRSRDHQSAIPSDILEKLTPFYSKEQVVAAFRDVSDESGDKDPSTLWLSVMCHLRQQEVYNSRPDSRNKRKDSAGPSRAQPRQVDLEGSRAKKFRSCNDGSTLNPCSSGPSHAVKACSSSSASAGTKGVTNISRLPPLMFGQTFEEAYDVILILDDREKFATKGSKPRNIVDNICSEFKMKIEVRRLPVGDCLWIARHKYLETEYVLDFIAERKKVYDMRSSIRDNRYRDQKLRLQRSGLKKLIYILEGDPNHCDAAESIKTACFTTEILEGFDVHRTNGLGETLRKYGHLTKSIYQYYKSGVKDNDQSKLAASCPSFDGFVKRCEDLEKMTISDVFAIQLMQVPQVTEEIAIAVLDMYPTLSSLASAYSHLDGNVLAQEEMLKTRSNNGCDASLLLKANESFASEKDASPDLYLKRFDVIDDIKYQPETVCPGVVSCSDILALAAREAVLLAGGPLYLLKTGRKDSVVGFKAIAELDLPSPQESLVNVLARFYSRGFNERETVSLFGAHSIGIMHCRFFEDRLYNFSGTSKPDPQLNPWFLQALKTKCPFSGLASFQSPSPSSGSVPLLPASNCSKNYHMNSGNRNNDVIDLSFNCEGGELNFGTRYWRRLLQNKGLLFSDQQLTSREETEIRVRAYASDQKLFHHDCAMSMMKLSSYHVLTGPLGQVRAKCSQVLP